MRDFWTLITEHAPLVGAGAVVVLSLLLGFVVRRFVLASLARVAAKTTWGADDLVVSSLGRPLPIWFLFGGLFVALQIVSLPSAVATFVSKVLVVLLITTITLWAASLGARLFDLMGPSDGAAAARSAGVIRYVVKIAVLAVGVLVLLSTLGISVTPVLTTVGIGGLAVALGLQETLANLFAGIQVTLAGNIRIGDFVRLESGEEGYVEDISWRASRIRTLPNNSVLIPNSRLAQSVVTNYHRPSRDLAVLVQVGVHYASDLDHVERVSCEVARKIMKNVPGGVPDFEPFIRYHTFGESSIDFTVILRAREFGDNFVVKHEFIKALMRAFKAERIVIPYPIRAVNLEQEGVRLDRVDGRATR
jgi:small-conductance mechanosensitive channel